MIRPELESLLQRASQSQAQGRLDEAEALCSQVLALDPASVPAKVFMGGLTIQKGEPDRGLALLRDAVAAGPTVPLAWMALAMGLKDSGRPEEALKVAQELTQKFPGFAPGFQAVGLALCDCGRLEEALDSFRNAIELKPDLSPAHFYLSSTLQTLGRRTEAIAGYRHAIKINPDAMNAMANLAQILLNEGELREARELAERLVNRWPRFATGHLLLGQVLTDSGAYAGAEAEIRMAIELSPKESRGQQSLAFLLIDQGRTEEAKAYLQASIELQPKQGGSYYYLAQLNKTDESDLPLIENLKAMLETERLPPLEMEYLNFALGKSYDDLGRWEEAMRHFEEGHRIAHARAVGERHYDLEADVREKNRIIEILDETFLRKHQAVGLETDLPIYICGMIRSGTTLMEQIVSSHPLVGAAGEQTFWTRNWWTALDRHSARLDGDKLRRITEEYLQTLRDAAPGKPRVTDKMPGNVLILGLIHLALPNAKIIHMQRHPVDTCLSIMTTRFTKLPDFACTRQDLVRQYRLYLEMVDHWRKVLPPDRFMDVRYEQLLEDSETVIRKIVDFLGLPWDEACLQHEKNMRSVKTPSVWKVRQPLYKSSMERWRRYEPWLGELAQLLPAGTGNE